MTILIDTDHLTDNLAAAGKGELPQDIYEAAKTRLRAVLSVHQAAAP